MLNVSNAVTKFGPWQSEFLERSGETHSVHKPECEDECDPPGLKFRKKNIFDGDVCNRNRNEGFDDPRRHGNQAVHGQAERD